MRTVLGTIFVEALLKVARAREKVPEDMVKVFGFVSKITNR